MGAHVRALAVESFSDTIEFVGGVSRATNVSELAPLCAQIDVLVDFSAAKQMSIIARACADGGCALVSGTTGLGEEEMQELSVASRLVPILHAANFSIGVHIVARALAEIAPLLKEKADIEILEKHHRSKADAPSGTALFLGGVIAYALGTSLQDSAVWPCLPYKDTPRAQDTIHFSSQRGGDVVGTHRIDFFCPEEVVTLEHQALDRRVFARGALQAALWIRARAPKMYTMEDVLS
jgi:4-hydroxy-tetrahydrodipicolinate reductase